MHKNILLLFGGGGSEHEISAISVKHVKASLEKIPGLNFFTAEIKKDSFWYLNSQDKCELMKDKSLTQGPKILCDKIDYVIPCIHGYPGETGDLQSYLEMIGMPYMGCGSEASKMCFNKVTTKLWARELGIPVVPFIFLMTQNQSDILRACEFLKTHKEVVVKASNQGSSVGCYLAKNETELAQTIKDAFSFSPFVLIEQRLFPREIEVSTYQMKNEVFASFPGEIICPTKFYDYQEKYSADSKTYTVLKAENLSADLINKLQSASTLLFQSLKLKDLSRIDYFVVGETFYLNEINTFPGMTPISMFPKMMEANGHLFSDFLRNCLE
jgi:D-alanine-D-alanine ligase